MLVNNKQTQAIWFNQTTQTVEIIDQRKIPFEFKVLTINSLEDAFTSIKDMIIRGAPLIGIMAAYGIYLAAKKDNSTKTIIQAGEYLKSSRPTAVNLAFVVDQTIEQYKKTNPDNTIAWLLNNANKVEANEIEYCNQIGEHGLQLIENIYQQNKKPVNILTHCNAGWLACGDWGTATAPIYKAHLKGIPVHVWVDETRPRNQGAKLTAWEMQQAGVPYTLIPDNTGGHLMQHQMVDLVIVGSDRTTRNGDVANKIGTYLKALAAKDNNIPFYVALPSSSIDFTMTDGVKNIPIEQRDAEEVTIMDGLNNGKFTSIEIVPSGTPVANYGFDVTPAKLVSGIITERGICDANERSLIDLFPEQK